MVFFLKNGKNGDKNDTIGTNRYRNRPFKRENGKNIKKHPEPKVPDAMAE